MQQTEQNWATEFAEPLMQKRKEVDQGNATVAELQIFYLQKDAARWVKNATEYLETADQENKQNTRRAPQSRRNAPATGPLASRLSALWPHWCWA